MLYNKQIIIRDYNFRATFSPYETTRFSQPSVAALRRCYFGKTLLIFNWIHYFKITKTRYKTGRFLHPGRDASASRCMSDVFALRLHFGRPEAVPHVPVALPRTLVREDRLLVVLTRQVGVRHHQAGRHLSALQAPWWRGETLSFLFGSFEKKTFFLF